MHITKTRPNHKFASVKNGKTISARRLDIKSYLYLLEFDYDVIDYSDDTQKILIPQNEKYHAFKPDLMVRRRFGQEVVFIDKKKLLTGTITSKLKSAYFNQNIGFLHVNPEDYLGTPYLYNMKLLYKYARTSITHEHHIVITKFFTSRNAATIEDLQIYMEQHSLDKTDVFSLIFHKHLLLNLEKEISDQTIIRIVK